MNEGLSFSDAIKTCYHKFFTINARACRSEYWYFVLFAFVAHLVLSFCAVLPVIGELAGGVGSLLVFIPFVTVSIRRMHDLDKSGLWLLFPALLIALALFLVLYGALATAGMLFFLGIVLILASAVSVVLIALLMAQPGTHGQNRFGPDPFQPKIPFSCKPWE